MAQYDGSIRINTQLNTRDFERSSMNLTSSMNRIGSSLNRITTSFGRRFERSSNNILSGIKRIESSLGGIISSLGFGLGIAGLVALGKQAIDTASDIQEVQNVVDTAFGSMSYKMEEFAKTSVKQFGISQLSAKQLGSTFAAMGRSMVGDLGKATDMAVALTGRAADMASFYNKSAEETATALKSIYTGETETLKEYGVVMTQTNLQEYAAAQGINKKISAMTQAEQVQLRYNYVMQQTSLAAGDFAKTSGSWANQTRILSEQFKELLSVLGSGLITVLTPVVQFLNTILGQLIAMAKQIGAILSKLFGISVPIASAAKGTTGIASGMSDAADSMDSAAGSAGDLKKGVEKAGKAAQKSLAPFDKLNVLAKETASSSSDKGDSGDGGGSIDIPTVDMSEAKETEGAIEKIKTDISSLYELGDMIGQKLIEAMKSIPWDEVYSAAGNFGTGLAQFLNGLISPGLFDALGTTIANSLNTALHFLDSFGDTFDWKNFGKSISASINSFFKNFDWELAAETFNTLAGGILDAIIEAVEGIDWKQVRDKIVKFIEGLDFKGISIKLGKLANALANALYTLVSDKKTWKLLGEKIADGINGFFKGLNEVDSKTGLTGIEALGKSFSSTISGVFTSIATTLKKTDWEEIGGSIVSFFANIDWIDILTSAADLILSLANGIYELIKGALKKDKEYLKEYLPKWIEKLGEYFISLGVKIGEKVSDFAEKIKNFIKNLPENLVSLGLKIGETISGFSKKVSDFLLDLPEIAFGIALKIASTVSDISKKIGDFIGKLPSKAFGFVLKIASTVSDISQKIGDFIEKLPAKVFKFGLKILSKVPDVGKDIKEFLEKIPAKVFKFLLEIGSTKKDIGDKISSFIKSLPVKYFKLYASIGTTIKSFNSTIKRFIKNTLKLGGTAIKLSMLLETSAIKYAIKTIVGWINTYVIGSINKISVKIPDWVIGMGGKTFGFNINKIPIPQLANGAVIRGGDPFMAVLGDQPRGQTNIETPLPTMVKAFKQAMAESGGMRSGNITVQAILDGKIMYEETVKQNNIEIGRTGKNRLAY